MSSRLKSSLEQSGSDTSMQVVDIQNRLCYASVNASLFNTQCNHACTLFNRAGNVKYDEDEQTKPHDANCDPKAVLWSELTHRKRLRYESKKRRTEFPSTKTYRPYTDVNTPWVRPFILRIARLFRFVDKLFARSFLHLVREHMSDLQTGADLKGQLESIRQRAKTHGSTSDDSDADNTWLGDLGHYLEDLLDQQERLSNLPGPHSLEREMPFVTTDGSDNSLLRYLEDSLETPYWEMILEQFSRRRANEAGLNSEVILRALHSVKFEVRVVRHQLQDRLDESTAVEGISSILQGIDERISILDDFTDSSIWDIEKEERELLELKRSQAVLSLKGSEAIRSVSPSDQQKSSSTALLVLMVLISVLGAVVPFAIGFAITWGSTDTGAISDADFWYNISSNILAIMANFVMIVPLMPLIKGTKMSTAYATMWIWLLLGIACAIVSAVIYPDRNTVWSSLSAFFAAIAAFGATLSITLAVGSEHSEKTQALLDKDKKNK